MKDVLFGKYEVIKKIGEGGFSTVYLVKDIHLNKLLSAKKMKNLMDENIEVIALKELDHPGLPHIYDYRKEGEDSYLFMEYVEGMTLREYLNKHHIVPLKIALSWVGQICDILSYLHKCNPPYIYRDLKPENIMIRLDGTIKLVDFGAILIRSHNLDEKRDICGTKGYTAPEIFKGARGDASSDVYSLGAVFHEMITGINPNKPPFMRLKIREYDKALPKGLEKVIYDCLLNNPNERYQTMTELKNDIINYRKVKIGRSVGFLVRKLLVGFAYIAFILSIILPLREGVDAGRFPLPFIKTPLIVLACAVLLRRVLLTNRGNNPGIKVEKDVFLTGKKYIGLLVLCFMLGAAGMMLIDTIFVPNAYAKENESDMWVELRDEKERKMLVKNGCVYEVTDKVRLEIPKESIPNENMTIKVIATDESGKRYASRDFLVKK